MKNQLIKIGILMLLSTNTFAARVGTTGKITKLYTYSEQAGFDGDIFIILTEHHSSCPGGFWLRSADTVGYKNTVSFLMTSFVSGIQVDVSALSDPSNIWAGHSAATCRMDQITLSI